jgi:ATP-dependent DNA helicase RecG
MVMNNPEWEAIDQQQLSTNRTVPVYPLTARITQKWLRHQIDQVLAYWAERITDPLPAAIRQPAGLVDLSTAIKQIHFPNSWEDQKKAQERLAFEEIFMLQLGVIRQKAWQERSARSFQVTDQWLKVNW